MDSLPQTKNCWHCKQDKPLEEMARSRSCVGGYAGCCRLCKSALGKASYREHRDEKLVRAHQLKKEKLVGLRRTYIEYKESRGCMDCGGKFPHYVLDFDHRDPSEKRYSITDMISNARNWPKVLEEIAKCDLVCANCHRVRTQDKGHFSVRHKKVYNESGEREGAVFKPKKQKGPKPRFVPLHSIQEACELYRSGESLVSLGDRYGVDRHVVSRCLKQNGVAIRRKGTK